jgi:hypothetical protein
MGVACSSSSTSVTSPTSTRCPVQLSQTPPTIAAAGGSGQITIGVNRECTWEARSEADWITLVAPTTGQGEANLAYSVSANPAVSVRRGAVVVNDQRIEVAQSAAACRYGLSAPGGSAGAGGGSMTVTVTAQPTCRWTAVSQVDWLRVDAGREGDGQGVATISVAPNGGPAREGTVIIAAQMFSVSQSAAAGPSPVPGPQPGCDFTAMADSNSFAAAGGEGTVRVVVAGPGCAWMAMSNVPWISLVPAGGNGPGSVRFVVAANGGAARVGTLIVASSTIDVFQAAAATPGCELSVSPQSESFPATGGDGTVRVTASGSSCGWSAASSVFWITLATSSGSGGGNIRYSVVANPGAARTGTLRVAGVNVTVTQAAMPACQYEVSPTSESFSSNGGNGHFRIRAADGCAWSAVPNVSWISLRQGNGSGNGNAQYAVAANTGAARTGTLTVAGTVVTINQEAARASSETILHGEVADLSGQCPSLRFDLDRRLVRANGSTPFDERCDHLQNRRDVSVWGTEQSDSSVLARRVDRGR